MRLSTSILVLLTSFSLSGLLACAESPGSGPDACIGKCDDSGALAIGSYDMATDYAEGTLRITSASLDSVQFHLYAMNVAGGNDGQINGEFVADGSGSLVYTNGDDCTISLTSSGSVVHLEQTGGCVDAGFGASVLATGDYRLRAGLQVGSYEMSTVAVEGTLTITSATPDQVEFSLFVFNNTGANNQGETAGSFDRDASGALSFVVGDDCTIVLTELAGGVHLEQTGGCIEANFGNGVSATGDYVGPLAL